MVPTICQAHRRGYEVTSPGAYVGRVGGLAVALGIGAAIVGGQAVASADPSDPSSDSASSESSATSAGPATDDGTAEESGRTVKPRSAITSRPTLSRQVRHTPTVRSVRPRANPDSSTTTEATPDPGMDEEPTTAPEPTPEKVPGTSRATVAVSAPAVDRSSKRARQQVPDTRPDEDSGPVEPAQAQTTPSVISSAPSLSITSLATTPVDHDPPIARSTPQQAPGIITRLLAPSGFGALAANSPFAPASATSLMGFLELVRRELNRLFVNTRPAFTYELAEPADGVITGRVTPVDADSTDFTYTATSPAQGDVFIDVDGTFTFTPNANYDPNTGASFTVTISDAGSDFHIHGLSGLLNVVTFGLIGDSGHTRTQTIVVGGVVPPPSIDRTPVVSGLTAPTDFRFLPRLTPGGPDRILFAEKGGGIKFYNGTAMQDQPVITLPTQTHWARGVNGIEVDPDFNTNGYIYVSYIGADNIQRLSRFTVAEPTAEVLTIDPTTETVLIQGDQPAGDDHHGGEIRYIGGKLYWTTGDNVCCSVVDGSSSQSLSNIYGKVLRLNPDGSAPVDNPFYTPTPGAHQYIYALGLRNPFRGGVTPDGRLLIGDVGQDTWEEINLVSAGANFGWPYAEGVCPGPGVCQPGSDGSTNPIYAYHEPVGGSSITSILVYRGDGFEGRYDNAVFFADHNRGWVKVMHCDAGFTSCGAPSMFIPQAGRTTRLEQGPDGNIYQLTLSDGTLWRISPPSDEPLTV